MSKTKTYEDALAAQTESKESIKVAKQALTDYYKDNKLKRTEDYSEDKKHGKKISNLEKAVEKAQARLKSANEDVKELKVKTDRKSKYDYPADVDTAEKRKKYRQEMRKAAAGEGKPKKEKKEKVEKVEKASTKAKKPSKKKPVDSEEDAPTKKVKKGVKKVKVKKSKKAKDD